MNENKIVNRRATLRRVLLSFSMLLTLLLAISNLGYGQQGYATLKGKVVELKDGKTPVDFASIQILPQGAYAATNSKGEFNFEKLVAGRVNVKIEFLGMESIDTTFSLSPGSVTTVTFKMQQSSFRLTEVSVVAQESKAGRATASNISRQAMDHLQTSSLSDIMQLLPGGVTVNPNLSTPKTFTIRSIDASASEMNSLGTAIIVDGAPLSNNANMQTLSPAISGGGGSIGGGSSPSSGLDIRSISTDNIESVEVIRGIPSVEYGDLTSGAVLIKSKAGKEPLTIRFKTDPRIYQTSIAKGLSLGEKRGNLNLSGDYAYSVSDVTESYAYYQRAAVKALYSNLFGNLSSNTSIDLSLGKDTRETNPNDLRSQLSTGAKDLGIIFNTNGVWNINKGWLNNIKYTVSGSYRDKHSFKEELLGNAFAPYSMSNTDGAVLSNYPNYQVQRYDVIDNVWTLVPFSNIPANEAGYTATFLPNEYFHRYDIYGKEVNVYANINATFAKKIGNVTNRILVGANFKSDGNLGDGKVYDLATPPYRVLSSANSSPRPRRYSNIPFINQISLYGEENLTWEIGEREVILQVGGRYDNINGKNAITPRSNLSLEIIPQKFWIRGGYGVHAKAPTALYLYPEQAYFDFVHFNTMGSSTVPEDEQLIVVSTRVFDTSNPDLEIAKNSKSEVGFDVRVNKMRFSVTGFQERIKNGYSLGSAIDNFKLIQYIQYEEASVPGYNPQQGVPPHLQGRDTNNIFVSFSSPANNINAHNRGIEFDFDFGRIDAIRTSFVLNGAYMRGTEWNNNHRFGTQTNLNSLEKNIAVYDREYSKDERERLVTTLRATHNIPSIGFVFTATAQVNWINKVWTTYGNDEMFTQYISREDGQLYPFDPALKDDPEFAYMFEVRSPTRFIAESYFPFLLLNFHLTKEIGDNLKASFYANNMFNYRPLYESKRSPGSFSRLGIPLYFGFELSLKIK
ncbi:MAG: carboxypeptidase-like regulatory domain-containing protein [Bacteroidales bacterium]